MNIILRAEDITAFVEEKADFPGFEEFEVIIATTGEKALNILSLNNQT